MIMGLKTAELKGLEVWTNTFAHIVYVHWAFKLQQDKCEDTFFMAPKNMLKLLYKSCFQI